MNCCEQNAPYSGCNQGRDCPVRSSRISQSSGSIHADWRNSQFFSELPEARKDQRTDTTSPVPPEAGNVWFVPSDLSPDDEIDPPTPARLPYSTQDKCFLGFLAITTLVWLALLAFVVGFSWARYGGSITKFGSWLLNSAGAWGLPG